MKNNSYRIVTPEEFDKYFDESHEELTGAKYCYVSNKSVEDYKDCTCIMFIDDNGVPEAYAAVNPEGVIESVLKDKDSCKKEFLLNIIYVAYEYGGRKLDCYMDNHFTLPYNYCDAGFMPVCRIRFDRSQIDGTWCEAAGTPDVVFMFFMDEGVQFEEYRRKVLDDVYPRFSSYDYIPYADELFDVFSNIETDDIYSFSGKIRDYAEDQWMKHRDEYKGRECDFVKGLIAGMRK